jgi:hypothetical protein
VRRPDAIPGRLLGLAGLTLLSVVAASAQELEPRAYSPSPTGANFVVLGYSRTTGDVLFDPSMPVTDVVARINGAALAYGRTFGLFGRSANIGLATPYVVGTLEGNLAGEFTSVRRSGLGDTRLRFAVNLLGGPALTPREFAQRRPRTTLGMSFVVTTPSGQYDPSKLVNLSSNRWAVKPELGLSYPRGRWTFDAYAGAWLFSDNKNFYGGSIRSQEHMTVLQAHVSYTVRPRLWIAVDATYYTGGRTTVDSAVKDDRQENSRAGLTLSIPIRSRHSLKMSWAEGTTTRIGGDFRTLGVAWQYLWF